MLLQKNKFSQRLTIGLAIYMVGILLGFGLAATSAWADLETLTFGFGIQPDETLTTLDCPTWITKDEVGKVRVSYTNTGDRPIDPLVRVSISEGHIDAMRVINDRQVIDPGQTAEFSWDITSEDAVYRRFVMVRVYTFQNLNFPSRGATCGVFVVNLPFFSGKLLFNSLLGLSLGLIGAGLLIFRQVSNQDNLSDSYLPRVMLLLAGLACLALLLSLISYWLLAWMVILLGLLIVTSIVIYSLART